MKVKNPSPQMYLQSLISGGAKNAADSLKRCSENEKKDYFKSDSMRNDSNFVFLVSKFCF